MLWEKISIQITFGGLEHPGSFAVPIKEPLDPYLQIQTGNNLLLGGSSAMNAWIGFECGLLNKEERNVV